MGSEQGQIKSVINSSSGHGFCGSFDQWDTQTVKLSRQYLKLLTETMLQHESYKNLRLVSASILAEYFDNTRLWRLIGNVAFAELVCRHGLDPFLPKPASCSPFRKPFVLFHSWLPGMCEISTEQAEAIGTLIAGAPARSQPAQLKFLDRLSRRHWCCDLPINLDDLVSQCTEVFAAIQNRSELRRFFDYIRAIRPSVVVEIGTARGGVLYGLSQLMSAEGLLVSIDLPGGRNCGGQTATERLLFSSFGPRTQEFHCICGDSTSPITQKSLGALLNSRKIDLLFIDGDHSYDAVRCDFEVYNEMVAADGLIALHDICMMPEEWGPNGAVGVLWMELAKRYQTETIVDRSGLCKKRLPPGLPPSWGIGLIWKNMIRARHSSRPSVYE